MASPARPGPATGPSSPRRTRPTYQAIVNQALAATGAATGWLLAVTEQGFEVLARSGAAVDVAPVGTMVEPVGARAYVVATGQPVALLPEPGDPSHRDAGGSPRGPSSVLAVPCGVEHVVAVLELADKPDATSFTYDDIDLVSLLAPVAAAALTERPPEGPAAPSPQQLGGALIDLAAESPDRYALAARLVEAMRSPR